MNTRQLRHFGLAAVGATALTIACNDSKNPNTPTPPVTTTTTSVAPTLAAPAAKSPLGGVQITGLRPTLEVENAKTTGTVSGTVTYRFEISERDDFPTGSRTLTSDDVPQGDGTTQWTVTTDLIPNTMYFWRARATNGTLTSDFSDRESVKTENRGFKNGQNIFDPLTNGQSVGDVIGGRFVPGEGWEATNLADAIDYNIPTMTSGILEFDVLGVEEDEPGPYDIGHKFYCMGSANNWDFWGFRNGDYKASLDKKTGRVYPGESGVVEHIFRIGDDDNRTKTGPRNWDENHVYHISLEWGNGRVVNKIDDDVIADEGYGGEYAPDNHRISLGCRPRTETLRGVRFSNVRIRPH
jgi:hypothetical protein